MRRTTAFAIALLTTACAHAPSVAPGLAESHRLVAVGDLAAADSALVACSDANPSNAIGAECRYRLVLDRPDPAHTGAPGLATQAARDYLQRDVSAAGRDDMVILARVAAQRESLLALLEKSRQVVASEAQTPLRDDGSARLHAEIERLRTELARTQDELNRIKRRLAAPRP